MEKRTAGIIATIATVLLCGCPGLFSLCLGAMFAVVGQIPGAAIDVFGSNDPVAALGAGLGGICLGLIFIAIPIIVAIVTLRPKLQVTPTSPGYEGGYAPPPYEPPSDVPPPTTL
jgi:hypothetical protein